MKYIGIDHHKQYLVATVLDEEGKVTERKQIPMRRETIREYFTTVKGEDQVKAVMEASYGWDFLYDLLSEILEEVKLAHPLKTKLIAEARIKNDTLDSLHLAQLLRADFIPEAYAPGKEIRSRRAVVRARCVLTMVKAKLKNHIHALLDRDHLEEEAFTRWRDKFGRNSRMFLRDISLPGHDTMLLHTFLDLLETVEDHIQKLERELQAFFQDDAIVSLLDTIPGIGKLFALLLRYELGDIERFPSPKKLHAYVGIVPSLSSSGGRTHRGRITKAGNRLVRWALLEAAQSAIRKDPYLARYYQNVALRQGKQRAKVAVARKLLTYVYWVWKERRPYLPDKGNQSRAVALYAS